MSRSTFLGREFFQRDPVTCARKMIGCELVWGGCAGLIVETEAYAATGDEACHTFARPSARSFIAKHQPGAAYVYFNYGMYWLLNVLVKGGTEDGFVLIRALEPTRGVEQMRRRRFGDRPESPPDRHLCSGPGKLTIALDVAGRDHGRDLCIGKSPGFRSKGDRSIEPVADRRVGISRAMELQWRFLARESAHVSVRQQGGERVSAKRVVTK